MSIPIHRTCTILFLLTCVACEREKSGSTVPPDPPPPLSLEVAIAPKTSRYSVRENQQLFTVGSKEVAIPSTKGFPILFAVRNPALTAVHIGYWTCSTYSNWRTDNPDVTLAAWPCFSNGVGSQEILPGETFAGEIGIVVSPRRIGERATFRLAFVNGHFGRTPTPPNEVFWSNPITLEIVE